MADKQPQLNGTYYGPTIPPAEAPRPRRHRNCCCCLFSICWKILLALIIFLVIVFIIFYAVLQPQAFKLYVSVINHSDATLTQFNYTSSDNTLRYNLVLNFTAGNPNKKLDFYYESVESHISYNGVTFASTDLLTLRDSFRQRRQSTNLLNSVYRGNYETVLDQDQVKTLEEDEKKRVFHFFVRLHFAAYSIRECEQWWRTYAIRDHGDGGVANVAVETRRGRRERWWRLSSGGGEQSAHEEENS
ncbi:NDR1/HIN1-like protein 10 [Vigna umbellata]|uniref:NDR1/HIN1-like protein 10 n=1 Tax=Vigna umbellata TaxID=87088 RepID=UPI001F5E94B4|nr:NDR1/HIN1-like protein 10 [Vigna umbellata]